MRHGGKPVCGGGGKTQRLGCYFCNDVVAPADSTRDRTLDQQCTVTRPGLAPMASAAAVELAVALLHHPDRHGAPAEPAPPGAAHLVPHPDRATHPLGALPHQIRGFLTSHSTVLPVSPAYDRCTACGPKVVEAYEADNWGVVEKACNDGAWLDRLTGLDELRAAADDVEVDWDTDDSDDGGLC